MFIQVQCCGIAMLLILFYFYKSQRRISLCTERAYWRMLCAVFVSLVLDIGSCVALTNADVLPLTLVKIVCKTYLASLTAVVGFILQYMGSDIYPELERYRKMMVRYYICAAVGITAIYILPIDYYVNKETGVLYTLGPSVIMTYAFSMMTIIVVLIRMVKSWKKMAKGRREGVLIGAIMLFSAAMVQFFNNQFLIVGYFIALNMVVLYLKLENPGYNIDTRTGLFNPNAFDLYTAQLYKNRSEFALIEIIYTSGSFRTEDTDELLTEVINYLLSIPNVFAFKNVGNEIIIVAENDEKGTEVLQKMRDRFAMGWGKNKEAVITPYWLYVPDPYIARSSVELLNMMRYVRQNSTEFAETHFAMVDSDLAESIKEEKRVTDLIVSALNDDRVEVYYQPIYSTAERRFTAAEALVRIRDKEGNIVPPGRFIKIAESSGLILKLGETVFRKVCGFIRDHDLKALGIHYVEVNLSVIQCGYEMLADDYISIMRRNNVPPDMINLEITESASLDTKSTLLRNMRKLMDFGVSFSLDDFGTGQSNLNYIIDMPVGIVKFDREMTNAYFENSKAKYIMNAAMNMIHGMNLDIVSEGVETEEQLRVLEGLKISYIQGFYFSKPLPVGEFIEFITRSDEQLKIEN